MKKSFFILWTLSLLGNIAVMPYAASLTKEPLNINLLFLGMFQAGVVYTLLIYFGLRCAKYIGFHIGFNKNNVLLELGKMFFFAIVLSSLILFLDVTIFKIHELVEFPNPSLPIKVIASLYGAINEEVAMRLFLVSFVVWGLMKISKSTTTRPLYVWCAIALSAVLFGAAHLPAMLKLTELTPLVFSRTLVLNGLGGILFGWLYWRKGLANAMICHGLTDIMLGVFPLIYS